MSKYLTTKKDSLEDMVAKVSEGKQSEDYKQLFKKELEKTGKGIGSMSDVEKKAFFNNIDKKHTAKNEGAKENQLKNVRTSPGEGTGAAGGPRLKDTSVKKSLKSESVNEEVELEESLLNKDGKPSMGKLKSAIDDVNNTKSMAGDKFGITNIDYREKNGKKFLDVEVEDGKGLLKALQRKYGKSVKLRGYSDFYIESVNEELELDNSLVSQVAKAISKRALKEGGVKDFLMDVEADAADMSLNDLIKKYYNQMGLSAQDLKKIFYRVNEELTAGQKKLPPALQKVIKDKEDKKEVKEELTPAQKKFQDVLQRATKDKESKKAAYLKTKHNLFRLKKNEELEEVKEESEEDKTIEQTIYDVWNNAAAEEDKRESEAKYYKTEEKKSLSEEQIKCPVCGHMNDAGAHKCSNCGASLKSESKDSNKKKAMTGSPATKVDTTPEVEYEH